MKAFLFVLTGVLILNVACQAAPTATPLPTTAPTVLPTVVPPTATLVPPTATPAPPTATTVPPTPTATATSAATLPGTVVVPLDKMAKSVPWLTLDKSAVPVVGYLGFNVKKAPFDNRLVRQAFAAAIDRKAIAALAVTLQGTQNARSAVTFTPPETLGRDLTGQVAVYDPVKARALLAQAGYPDGKGFPEITLASGSADAVFRLASAAVAAWNENLKINAKVQKIEGNYGDYIVRNDPNAIHFFLRIPEYNDPDSFLLAVYHTRARSNFGHFANAEFDRLVEQAAAATDPATRQALYISAERLLLDQEAATIPIYYLTFRQQ